MTLILYYSIGDITYKFESKLRLSEYYITSNYSEYRVFIKGLELNITPEEYERLNGVDFTICMSDDFKLFDKSEVVLTESKIIF